MVEMQNKLLNLLADGGKVVSITKQDKEPISFSYWHLKDKNTMLMYNKNDKQSMEISLNDIQELKKNGYKKYFILYKDGELINLKFRNRLSN